MQLPKCLSFHDGWWNASISTPLEMRQNPLVKWWEERPHLRARAPRSGDEQPASQLCSFAFQSNVNYVFSKSEPFWTSLYDHNMWLHFKAYPRGSYFHLGAQEPAQAYSTAGRSVVLQPSLSPLSGLKQVKLCRWFEIDSVHTPK